MINELSPNCSNENFVLREKKGKNLFECFTLLKYEISGLIVGKGKI